MIIGIVHHKSTAKFLPQLIRSLRGCNYEVIIVANNQKSKTDFGLWKFGKYAVKVLFNPEGGYELGALKKLLEIYPNEKDFFLMQESLLVKDQEVFEIAAEAKGSLAVCDGFCHFLGKYRREILEQVGIPAPKSRMVEILYEYFWNLAYINVETIENLAMLADTLPAVTGKFEVKFGRKSMVLENCYLKKWKSNWGQDGPYLKIPAGVNQWMPQFIR